MRRRIEIPCDLQISVTKLADRYLSFVQSQIRSQKALQLAWEHEITAHPNKRPELGVTVWTDKMPDSAITDRDYLSLRHLLNDVARASRFYVHRIEPNILYIQTVLTTFRMELVIRSIQRRLELPPAKLHDFTEGDSRFLRSLRIKAEASDPFT